MKISLSLLAFASASFKGPEITRSVSGEWVDKYIAAGRHRRQSERSDFSAIAAMIAYLQGEGADNVDPSTQNMEATLADIEKKYTNYGCYCWRNGAHKITAFSAGSGNVDWNDRACTRLYQCYNCIKNDYGSTYHEISYQAVFKTDAEGNRVIECADNAKSDGENVCRCDAAFAEAIKFNQDQCDNDAEDKGGKAYCINEEYRTANGGGDYVCPLTLKDDTGMKHDALPRDKCCGIYPNRIPYNPAGTDCCEERDEAADNVFTYKIKKQGICQENGGTVVVSQEGNPHSYIPTL